MKPIVLILACLAIAAVLFLVIFPPGTPYSFERIAAAYANPANQALGSVTVAAMYELQSNVILIVLLAIGAGIGGLVGLALGSGGKRQ